MAYDPQPWHAFRDAIAKVRREQDRLHKRLALGPATCVHCKTQPPRWDSLFCSDACKQAFMDFEEGL